jgi:hypothetical protein
MNNKQQNQQQETKLAARDAILKPITPLPWHVYCSHIGAPNSQFVNDGLDGAIGQEDIEYIVEACNSYHPLIEQNYRLRSALNGLVIAIDAPEVTVSTVADETWSNVLDNARNALNGGVS